MSELNRQKRKPKVKSPVWIILIGIFLVLGVIYALDYKKINNLIPFHSFKVDYGTYSVSFDNDIQDGLKSDIGAELDKVMLNGVHRFSIVDQDGDISLSIEKTDNNVSVMTYTLIPVGHMYSLQDSVSIDGLKSMNVFVLDGDYIPLLEVQYGISAQKIDSTDDLIKKMEESDNNVGLVNFNDIDYRMKILPMDGKYYLDDASASIPLYVYASVKDSRDSFIQDVLSINLKSIIPSGYEKDNLLKVNMTGVTAITRDLGAKMDKLNDYKYPAENIADFLADADLTHVSNEISFVDTCVQVASMRFCANPKSIETLQASGVDIVELTGNHNNDYGYTANTNTISTYTSLGLKYFGGGLNADDASKILYEDVKGTKVAFIGYNWYDTVLNTGAIASDSHAGANSWSEEKMKEDITNAKANADIVIVDFQFQECYSYPDSDVIYPICYQPLTNPDQVGIFREAVDLGATIVIGTQAHQPQTYELYDSGAIFYGLGNLFFDQNEWIGTRQGMVLTHYFYNGKYIQTKITPTMMDMDLQTRLATQDEGDLLLQLLKTAREDM